MKKYQLTRCGDDYGLWGDRKEVIDHMVNFTNRPWWWLRLCGWNVREMK